MLLDGQVLGHQLLVHQGGLLVGHGALGVQSSLLFLDFLVVDLLELVELHLDLGGLVADGALLAVMVVGILDNAAHLLLIGGDGVPALADFLQHGAGSVGVLRGSGLEFGSQSVQLFLAADDGVANGVLAVRHDGHLLLDLLVELLLLHDEIAALFQLLACGGAADVVGDAVRLHVLLLVLPHKLKLLLIHGCTS